MIQLIRIDDALLHGQVAVFWINSSGSNMILIADDKYASTPMLKMSLQVGKPKGIAMKILTVSDAIAYLNSEEGQKKKILLITSSVKDALSIAESISERPELNIGGIRNGEGKRRFSNRIHIDQAQADDLKKIIQLGFKGSLRETPMNDGILLEDVVKAFQK